MSGPRKHRRSALRLALASLAALWGTAARAQDEVPQVVSPLRVESDHNGVNLVSGRTSIDPPVLQAPAAPNLRFDRVQNAAPHVKGTITGAAGQIPEANYSVHAGGAASESFRCPDYDCSTVTGTGSTLLPSQSGRGPATYRQAGSGVRYSFNVLHVSTAGPPGVMLYYASNATWPNGETISYSYETAYLPNDPFNRPFRRPITVASNLGYHITISYHPGELGTMGWNAPAEATLYETATGALLGRHAYSLDGATITQYGAGLQNPRSYTCAGCANSLGAETEIWAGSIQLPTEGAPARQVAQATGGTVVGSVTRDGVQWNYAYLNLRPAQAPNRWLYDRLTVTGPNGFNQVYNVAQVGMGPAARNVITSMTDPIGRSSSFLFDEAYRPYRVVSPEGNQVDVAYDEYGNLFWRRTRAKPGSGLADIIEQAFYPGASLPNLCTVSCWRPTWSRDGLNRQTDFVYNASGQLTQQDEPADANGVRRRTIVEYALSPNGQISRRSVVRVCGVGTTCGTNQEHRTEYLYWGNTNLVSRERRVDSATGAYLDTDYTYDNAGRLLSTDGPLAGSNDTVYNRYDEHGRKTWEIGQLGANGLRIASRNTYRNSDDKLVATEIGTLTDPGSSTLTLTRRLDIGYDGRRNPFAEAVTAPSGAILTVVQRTFDESSRLECQAARMNPAAFAPLPASACLLGPQGSHGPDRITRNTYDAAGQLLIEQRAYATLLQQNYASYSYSPNGKRTSVTDANGNRAELRYDGHDRQNRWVFPHPSSPGAVNEADYEAYGYDLIGNRTSLRRRDGVTLTSQYDNLNRMIVKVVPERAGLSSQWTRDVYYGYDLRNLPLYTRFDSHSGDGVINQYDAFGRQTASTISLYGTSRTLNYLNDAAGRRTRITHPDGAFFTTDYDAADRQGSITDPVGSALASFSYDPAGFPNSVGRPGATTGLQFRADGPLTSLSHYLAAGLDVHWTFAHNPARQIYSRTRSNNAYAWTGAYNVDRSYSVNGLNQYTAAGPASFAYSATGNLTSDGSRSFDYDQENRLIWASGTPTTALVYDPLGRLFQVTSGANTTTFLYDGDALVAEYNSAGTLTARYVHGSNAGADDPLVWYPGAGTAAADRRNLLFDHQGSIVAISDNAGNRLAINAYDEWGIPNATNTGRFQYTGQIWLSEIGMYHYKARIYSPTLGRFLQTDPVGYDDQINLYAYVGNDPVNWSDPEGSWSKAVHDRLFALALRDSTYPSFFPGPHWRVTRAGYSLVARQSRHQDTRSPAKSDFRAHYLRSPGENPAAARQRSLDYIRSETEASARAFSRGDDAGGLRHYANAGHAIADSYSPVHRGADGNPQEYRSTGEGLANEFQDAVDQNHSPLDSIGGEGTDDLARSGLERPLVNRLSRLFDQVTANRRVMCTGSRLLRTSC